MWTFTIAALIVAITAALPITMDPERRATSLRVLAGKASGQPPPAGGQVIADTPAVWDVTSARDRLSRLPGDEDGTPETLAEYAPADWLMFLAGDLGQLAGAIQRHRWGDTTTAEMRHAAVALGGRTLAFIEQLDRGPATDDSVD